MSIPPIQREALTLERLLHLLDPHRVYYRPVIDDTLQRGNIAEIQALVASAKDLKAQYKDFDGLIKAGETALRNVQAK